MRRLAFIACVAACSGIDDWAGLTSGEPATAATTTTTTASATETATSAFGETESPSWSDAPVCLRWRETIDQVDLGPAWSGDLDACDPGAFENASDVALVIALYRWLAGAVAPTTATSDPEVQACALAAASLECGGPAFVWAPTHAVVAPRVWFADPSVSWRFLAPDALMLRVGSTSAAACVDVPDAPTLDVSWPPPGSVPAEALPAVWALWRSTPLDGAPVLLHDGAPVEVEVIEEGPWALGGYRYEVEVGLLGPGAYQLHWGHVVLNVTAHDCQPALWPQP